MLNIDPEECTDDESKAPAGGGRAEPMAMTPDRPSQAASRGESVPGAKVRELEEGLKRATFHDKDVAGTSENREAVEALFEGSDLSDFLRSPHRWTPRSASVRRAAGAAPSLPKPRLRVSF